MDRFQHRLFNSIATIKTRSQSSSSGSTILVPPPQAHLNLSRSSTISSSNAAQHNAQPDRHSRFSQVNDNQAASTISGVQTSQFLLLCVNTRSLAALVHVEVGPFTTDQYMFQQILQEYQKVRGGHEWNISMACPSWARNILNSISKSLPRSPSFLACFSWPRLLLSALSEMRLYKIHSGDFVRVRFDYRLADNFESRS